MGRRRLYSWDLLEQVKKQLPTKVLEALEICGWNAFGVYELVDTLRQAERKKKLKKGLGDKKWQGRK